MEMKQVAYEAAKATPPGAVAVANKVFDMTLSDAVMYLTLIYTAVQLGFFLYDRYNLYKKAKANGTT
jgi:hypothetical protein